MFNEAHLHLLVNHAPVVIFALALLWALACLFSRELTLHRSLYWMVLLGVGGAAAAYFTGEPAEHFVHGAGVPVSDAYLSAHERWAEWLWYGAIAAGVLALAGLIANRGSKTAYVPAALMFLLLLLVNVVGGVTAALGGAVRHAELHDDGFHELLQQRALTLLERDGLAGEQAELYEHADERRSSRPDDDDNDDDNGDDHREGDDDERDEDRHDDDRNGTASAQQFVNPGAVDF